MRKAGLAIFAVLSVVLGGCSAATPLVTPNSPRNGADQVVDPVLGTPIPGTPQGNAGRS